MFIHTIVSGAYLILTFSQHLTFSFCDDRNVKKSICISEDVTLCCHIKLKQNCQQVYHIHSFTKSIFDEKKLYVETAPIFQPTDATLCYTTQNNYTIKFLSVAHKKTPKHASRE
jgi:hypothetical protein